MNGDVIIKIEDKKPAIADKVFKNIMSLLLDDRFSLISNFEI